MPQFDVHRNSGTTRRAFPYLLVLQSSLFSSNERWVIIPMAPTGGIPRQDQRLHPEFLIEGLPHFLATIGITNVPRDLLGSTVTNLAEQSDRIIDAVDWMMSRGWH